MTNTRAGIGTGAFPGAIRYLPAGLVILLLLVSGYAARAQAPGLPGDLDARRAAIRPAAEDWLLYGGNYGAWRYSGLTEVTKSNVGTLRPAWELQTGMHDAFEASAVVADGVMYLTTPWNNLIALAADTGEVYWRYAHTPASVPLCCGAVNRGAAVADGLVFMGTVDAKLLAFDAKTGEKVWDVQVDDPAQGYSITTAPQVIPGKVLIGVSGGEYGVRGHITAYDTKTGHELWRFYTVPQKGEKGNETWEGDSWKLGGAVSWMPATWDPDTNTLYCQTGNPGPDLDGSDRKGSNLYSNCLLALDADTGKLKWHYQTIPHDTWDLDNMGNPVLATITVNGSPRKVVMFTGKSGYFFVLDRKDGSFIRATQIVHKVTWGRIDANGKPVVDDSKRPVRDRWIDVYPGASGGKEWCPIAYDPERKLAFVPLIEMGSRHKVIRQEYRPGLFFWGGVSKRIENERPYGHILAIDVETGKIAWDVHTDHPMLSGITCTASGLVITGTADRKMLVLDADTGSILHTFTGRSGWHGVPVVYSVKGKEYIAFPNGWGGTVFPKSLEFPRDNTMYVFTLPGKKR